MVAPVSSVLVAVTAVTNPHRTVDLDASRTLPPPDHLLAAQDGEWGVGVRRALYFSRSPTLTLPPKSLCITFAEPLPSLPTTLLRPVPPRPTASSPHICTAGIQSQICNT